MWRFVLLMLSPLELCPVGQMRMGEFVRWRSHIAPPHSDSPRVTRVTIAGIREFPDPLPPDSQRWRAVGPESLNHARLRGTRRNRAEAPKRVLTGGLLVRVQPGELLKGLQYAGSACSGRDVTVYAVFQWQSIRPWRSTRAVRCRARAGQLAPSRREASVWQDVPTSTRTSPGSAVVSSRRRDVDGIACDERLPERRVAGDDLASRDSYAHVDRHPEGAAELVVESCESVSHLRAHVIRVGRRLGIRYAHILPAIRLTGGLLVRVHPGSWNLP